MMSHLHKAMTRNKGSGGGEKKHTAGEEDTPRNVAMEQSNQEVREQSEAVVSMKKVLT